MTCLGIGVICSKLLLGLLLLTLVALATASDAGSEATGADGKEGDATKRTETGRAEIPDDVTLLKMKVRELKEFLARKGSEADCVACTSKREYIDRIHETADWPDATPSPSSADPPLSDEEVQKLFAKTKDPEYMRELREKLKAAGINADTFSGQNIDADELAKKFRRINLEHDGNEQKQKDSDESTINLQTDGDAPSGDNNEKSDL